jgi:hypothetical protein
VIFSFLATWPILWVICCQHKNTQFLSLSAITEHSSDILKDRRNMKTWKICTDESGRNVDMIVWCGKIQKDSCIEN